MVMTAAKKIKQLILKQIYDEVFEEDEIDELWWDVHNEDVYCDVVSLVREGDEETEIGGEYSRHYESKSVAAKMLDGSWVGWTYWYGGGKHGEPESKPWIEQAYDLDVSQVTVVKNVFVRR